MDDYEKIKNYIKKSKYRTSTENDECLASEVYIYRLENPNRASQHYSQSIIDCLRKHTGRKGGAGYTARKQFKNATGFDDVHGDSRATGHDVGEREDPWKHIGWLRGVDRACLILKEYWGFNETEIANIFGVSKTRIYQRIKGIQSCLSKRVKKKEQASKRKRENKMETVLRKKTNRIRRGVEQEQGEFMEVFESW